MADPNPPNGSSAFKLGHKAERHPVIRRSKCGGDVLASLNSDPPKPAPNPKGRRAFHDVRKSDIAALKHTSERN